VCSSRSRDRVQLSRDPCVDDDIRSVVLADPHLSGSRNGRLVQNLPGVRLGKVRVKIGYVPESH
jgi:hypothetical protein